MNCDMCDKEISEEEYVRNGGLCDECSADLNVHYHQYGLDDYTEPYKDAIDDDI